MMYLYTPWKSWSNCPKTPAPFFLSRLLIGPSWFLSVGTLPKGIRPQMQEEQSQSFRSSWILRGKSYFKRNFLLITSWILRGKNIFKRKVYLTTSCKQDHWRSCPWKPWHSSSHQQSIFLVSLVNKSAQLSVLVYLIKRLIVHNKKKISLKLTLTLQKCCQPHNHKPPGKRSPSTQTWRPQP